MKTYIFAGSAPIGATIDGTNVFLVPGRTYELPEGNSFVQGLVAQGLLVETRDRADNFIGDGRKISYTVPGGQSVAAGALVAVGNIVGVAESEGSAAEVITLSLDGIWEFDAAAAITAGDRVYRSGATAVNKTNTNPFVGVAITNSASGKVRVRVLSTGDGGGNGGPLVFMAKIDQAGSSAPTIAQTIKNDFGAPSFSYVGEGLYYLTFGAQPTGAVGVLKPSTAGPVTNADIALVYNGTQFEIRAYGSDGLGADGLISGVTIKIEIYP